MSLMLTLKELASFHSVDIQAVARLVKKLSFDHNLAKQIVSFWFLLERLGNKDFIKNILSWSIISFHRAANEAITCLEFLQSEVYHRLLQAIVPRDVANVPQIEPGMAAGEELIRDSWIKGGQGDSLTIQDLYNVLLRSKGLLITSYKGHHVTKEELYDFFARRYEDLVDLHTVPWFALVVFIFPSKPTAIVKGKSPVMLNINGEVVSARRYKTRGNNSGRLVAEIV